MMISLKPHELHAMVRALAMSLRDALANEAYDQALVQADMIYQLTHNYEAAEEK